MRLKLTKSSSNGNVRFVGKCFLIVLVGAILICCEKAITEKSGNIDINSAIKRITHPNGLRLNAPENLTVSQTADGFLVIPPPSRGMSGLEIAVRENASLERLPKKKKIGDRTINYTIERQAGVGSGGDEYAITAVERIGNRTVEHRQSDLSETNEPSFDFFWSMVEATSL